MKHGFITISLDVRTNDGLNFILLSPLLYRCKDGRVLRVPIGSTTDGLSVPKPFWSEIAPFGKESNGTSIGWKSGILHDGGYRNTLEVFLGEPEDYRAMSEPGKWNPIDLSQADCDSLIEEALESEGLDRSLDEIVYKSLRACGGKAYREDRAIK